MANKITEHPNGFMISVGDKVHIERTMTPVGVDVKTQQPVFAWRVYVRTSVKNGIHPVHKTPTSETEVWVPHGEAHSKEEALSAVKKLKM